MNKQLRPVTLGVTSGLVALATVFSFKGDAGAELSNNGCLTLDSITCPDVAARQCPAQVPLNSTCGWRIVPEANIKKKVPVPVDEGGLVADSFTPGQERVCAEWFLCRTVMDSSGRFNKCLSDPNNNHQTTYTIDDKLKNQFLLKACVGKKS